MTERRDTPPGVSVPPHIPALQKPSAPGARSLGGPGGGGFGGGPGGGGLGGGGGGFVNASPFQVKPPGGHDFQVFGTVTAGPAAAPVLFTGAGSTFLVPSSQVGVIRSVVFLANGLLTTSRITFSILFNNGGVEGWVGVPILPRLASSVSSSYGPEETYIVVPETTTISIQAQVADGVAYQVSALLHGWFFSAQLAAGAAI